MISILIKITYVIITIQTRIRINIINLTSLSSELGADVFEFSSGSFSLLFGFILSLLLRLGGTGGGVFSDSDGVGEKPKFKWTDFGDNTGGGERYGGGCLESDCNELRESMDEECGKPVAKDENDVALLRPGSGDAIGE